MLFLQRFLCLLLLTWQGACCRAQVREEVAFFPIEKDGLWGVIDQKGSILVEPSFTHTARATLRHHASQQLGQDAVLLVDPHMWLAVGQFGISEIAPPVAYSRAKFVIDNLGLSMFAIYAEGDLLRTPIVPSIVLDPLQEWQPPNGVSTYGEFSEGLIAVYHNQKFGFADRRGRFVIEPKYDGVQLCSSVFAEGLAPANDGTRWGYVDARGTWVIAPKYVIATPFDSGLARVWRESREEPPVMIDHLGRVVYEWSTSYPASLIGGPFSEGLSRCRDEKRDLIGFLDQKGNWKIPPSYDWALHFNEGLAPVLSSDPRQSGFVDHTGQVVVSVPNARKLERFSRGLAWAETPTAKGYIDRSGQWVWSTSIERPRTRKR